MAIKKKKISELPLAQSLDGLHTIGVNKDNDSVKVSLGFIKHTSDNVTEIKDAAISATKMANEAASKANVVTETASEAAKMANEAAGKINTNALYIMNQGINHDMSIILQETLDRAYYDKMSIIINPGTYTLSRAVYIPDNTQITGSGAQSTIFKTVWRAKAKTFKTGSEDYRKAVIAESYVQRDKRHYNTVTDPSSVPVLDFVNGHNRFFLGDGSVGYYDGDRDTNTSHPLYYPSPVGSGSAKTKWNKWHEDRAKIVKNGTWIGLTGRENYALGMFKSTQKPGVIHTTDKNSPDYIVERVGSRLHSGVRNVILRDFQITTNSIDRSTDSAINFRYSASLIPISMREDYDSSVLNIQLSNLYLYNIGGHGYEVTRAVQNSIINITARRVAGYGFYIKGVTSTFITGCYANSCLGSGYRLDGVNYSSLVSCAADSCSTAYNLSSCKGVVLNACGAEACRMIITEEGVFGDELIYKGRSFSLRECDGVQMLSCYAFTTRTQSEVNQNDVPTEDLDATINQNRHVFVSDCKDLTIERCHFKSLRRVRSAPFRNAAGDKCNVDGGVYNPLIEGSRVWQVQNYLIGAIFELRGDSSSASIVSEKDKDEMAAYSEIRDGNLDVLDPGIISHPDGHITAGRTLKNTDGNGGWVLPDGESISMSLFEINYPLSNKVGARNKYWKWRNSLKLLRVRNYVENEIKKQSGFLDILSTPVVWNNVIQSDMDKFTLNIVKDREETSYIDGNKSLFEKGNLFYVNPDPINDPPMTFEMPIINGLQCRNKQYGWGVRSVINAPDSSMRHHNGAAITIYGNQLNDKGTDDAILALKSLHHKNVMTSPIMTIADIKDNNLLSVMANDWVLGFGVDTKMLSRNTFARDVVLKLSDTTATTSLIVSRINALIDRMMAHGLIKDPYTPAIGSLEVTSSIVNVSSDSLVMHGEITPPVELVGVAERGFVYSKHDTMPTIYSIKLEDVTSTDWSINGTLTELAPNTTYYIRAYAKGWNSTIGYSDVITVQTTAIVSGVVFGEAQTDKTIPREIHAFCNYTGSEVLERGFVYSRNNSTPTVSHNKIVDTTSIDGNISAVINTTGFNGATYYIRSFAKITSEYVYGDVVTVVANT